MSNLIFYNSIYLLCNAMSIYSKYKAMYIFFDKRKIDKKFEIFLFIGYWLINSVLYLIFDNPLLNLITNIILLFLLTFIYISFIVKKLIAVVMVYAVSFFIESFFYLFLPHIIKSDSAIIIGIIISRLVFYFVVLSFNNFKNIKSNHKISLIHMMMIIFISACSIYISVFLILDNGAQNNYIHIILCISALFIINIFIFYIYDVLNKKHEEELEMYLLQQQNKYFYEQLNLMNQSQDNIKCLKHDINEHFIVLKTMADSGQPVNNYINEFLESVDLSGGYAKSGNIIVDSILNYKLQKAQNKKAKIDVDLKIPNELKINPFDMGVILGNLMDNAVEAISKKDDDRKIKISMWLEKNIIYINIFNTFDGGAVIENNQYQTTNEDKINHGFGIMSIKKTLEKYNGQLILSNSDSLFSAKLFLYNGEN